MTTRLGQVLEVQGWAHLPGALAKPDRQRLASALTALPPGAAGRRDGLAQSWCRALVERLRDAAELSPLLRDLVAVQCTLFEKSVERNWLVALHQDLAIPVAQRVEHPQLQGWSVKDGQRFVLAPAAVLERMLAVRIHLDDARQVDGGLRVVPGSHRHGVLDDAAVGHVRAASGEIAADACAGDFLLLRPLLLHASSKGTSGGRRRVLHLLFGPLELPWGLRWPQSV